MSGSAERDTLLHASCVALDPERAALIFGPSGSGKSSLALRLMALGCRLVSDDWVRLRAKDGTVRAEPPDTIRGQIEARGAGLLGAEVIARARVILAVDLGREETERLPPLRRDLICGVEIPLILRLHSAVIDAAILQYLRGGRVA